MYHTDEFKDNAYNCDLLFLWTSLCIDFNTSEHGLE